MWVCDLEKVFILMHIIQNHFMTYLFLNFYYIFVFIQRAKEELQPLEVGQAIFFVSF